MSNCVKYPFLTGPQHCGHPTADGALLVVPSRYVDLDEQVRTTDKFHANTVAKLQHRLGITMSDLQGYEILSEKDFQDANSPWYTAPIIVPINRDRYNLVHVCAVRFAKVNNTCVLRWRSIDRSYEQKPREELMDGVYKNDPVFWEYFVVGAPCSLNTTINKDLGLVNAVKGFQFSLMMDTEDDQNDVDSALHLHPPGSVIDIPCPLAVNVAFGRDCFTGDQLRTLIRYSVFDDGTYGSPLNVSRGLFNPVVPESDLRRSRRNACSSESLNGDYRDDITGTKQKRKAKRKRDNDVVIPILRRLSKTRDSIVGYGGEDHDPFNVVIQQRFPLDSDFAITVNRSQGQTLERVILAISHRDVCGCNFRYNGIYVAFSRVRDKESIRLLLVGDSIPKKWTSVSYVPNLRPDPLCHAVLNGWSRLGGENWQTNEWSCVLTRRTYENNMSNKRSRRNTV